MNSKSALMAGLALIVTTAAVADDNDINWGEKVTSAVYRVAIHNETENQWFSPCLCALHHRKLRLFQAGQAATTGQATFAEDGFNGILAAELRENPDVYTVLQCGPGLTPPGASRVEYISGPAQAKLTCAAMPVTTNDVLAVIEGVKTPKRLGATRRYSSTEWDLGSEHDNYSADSMPEDSFSLVPEHPDNPVTISENVIFGPAGRPAGVPSLLSPFSRAYFDNDGEVTAEGVMSVFFEYEGSDDFPGEIYGWTGSASRFSVTRVK